MLGKKSRDQEVTATPRARTEASRSSTTTSLISKQMHVRGDCVVDGRIRIEGRISGDVQAAGIELAESGTVEGDLSAADAKAGSDAFVIAGKVDGAVRAPRVDVSRSGSVLKGVEAEEAHVRGRVEGGILARRRLILEETAVVEGDVRARTLALKEGGQVNGTIVMGERAKLESASGGEEEDASKGREAGTGKRPTSAASAGKESDTASDEDEETEAAGASASDDESDSSADDKGDSGASSEGGQRASSGTRRAG